MASSSHLSKWIVPGLVAAVALAASTAWSDITPTGDVSPANPSTWTSTTTALIGKTSAGSLTVIGGSSLLSSATYLGYGAGSAGVLLIDGTASTWTGGNVDDGFYGAGTLSLTHGATATTGVINLGNYTSSSGTIVVDGTASTLSGSYLFDGNQGAGALNITNGGKVTLSGDTYIAYQPTSTGVINFGSNGGTLSTGSVIGGVSQITGTGTINARGLVSDVALVLDATHGLSQSMALSGPGQNVTLNLGLSASGTLGLLGAGYSGVGSLTIRDGLKVATASGQFAVMAGSTGMGTVSGTGSMWTMSSALDVGARGIGSLSVTDGATVAAASSRVGDFSGASGTLTVDGIGSSLAAGNSLDIGWNGNAVLNITNGASVSVAGTAAVAIYNTSIGAINFGANGGTLTARMLYAGASQVTGTGTINTRGLVGDGALLFDTTHGLSQSVLWNNAGQNVTINVNVNGTNGTSTDLGAGYAGVGTLTIQQGVKISTTHGYLGYQAGSAGSAILSGSGSSWTTSSNLYIGYYGAGTLSVTDGGRLVGPVSYLANSIGSAGTATVDGGGSSWTNAGLYVGGGGAGILNITNGATVSSSGTSYVGANPGATGSANIDGAGSMWTNSGLLYVGYSGGGMLNITGGGSVTCSGGILGNATSSSASATVDGAGSTWRGTLTVGGAGAGTLTITHGGFVNGGSSSSNIIGSATGSNGTATVDGTGSTWTCYGLLVGDYGTGTLNISNGGQVTAGGNAAIAYDQGGTGAIHFGAGGGTLTCGSFYGSPSQVTGTGTIHTLGVMSDGDFLFDATHGAQQTLTWNGANQNVTVNFDVSGSSGTLTTLGVGYLTSGTLAIRDGFKLTSANGYLGFKAASVGTATVSGTGSTWTLGKMSSNSGELYLGYSGTGILSINNGATIVNSRVCYFGYNAGATGMATVSGTGSNWIATPLFIGNSGSGTLNITSGGVVNASNSGNTNVIAVNAGSTGIVNIDGSGSIWSAANLYVGGSGTGAVNVTNGGTLKGSVWLANGTGSSGTMTVDGPGSTWIGGNAEIGYCGTGALLITNGGKVTNSITSTIGHNSGSSGKVMVNGPGSAWIVSGDINVGGTLNIASGGTTSCYNGDIDPTVGSAGVATVSVDGAGSTWTCTDTLSVGSTGSGALNITNGGRVTASAAALFKSSSSLVMNVGDGSILSVGTGGFTNNGTIRLQAAPGLAAGAYSPVTAGSWSGTGTVTALGGNWNDTSHTFTVAAPSNGTTDQPVSINTFQTQRIAITDTTTGNTVQAAFPPTVATSNLTFTASLLTDPQTSLLTATLPANTDELSAWTFTATNYTTGTPVFLSLDIGPGFSADALSLWHYDGTSWTPYAAADLSYDGRYANFTVMGFSGYAVSVATPEPGALALLALGGVGVLVRRRRTLTTKG